MSRIRDLYCETPAPGVVRVYPTPIRYYDEQGIPQPIDETLVEDVDGGWKNETNEIKSYITKRGRVTYTRGSYSAWIEPRYISVDTVPEANRVSQFQRTLNVVKDNYRKARIANIAPNVDIAWEVRNAAVKELIVLKSSNVLNALPTKATELHMAWDYGLPAGASGAIEDNHIVVRAPNDDVVFRILPVTARDSNGAEIVGQYSFRNGYLFATLDLNWFRAPERVWPIEIDPTVDTETSDRSWRTHHESSPGYPTKTLVLRFPLPALGSVILLNATFHAVLMDSTYADATVSVKTSGLFLLFPSHSTVDEVYDTYGTDVLDSAVLSSFGTTEGSPVTFNLYSLEAQHSIHARLNNGSTYVLVAFRGPAEGGAVQSGENSSWYSMPSTVSRNDYRIYGETATDPANRPYIEIEYIAVREADGALTTPATTLSGQVDLTRKGIGSIAASVTRILGTSAYQRHVFGDASLPAPTMQGVSVTVQASGALQSPMPEVTVNLLRNRHVTGALELPSPTGDGNIATGRLVSGAMSAPMPTGTIAMVKYDLVASAELELVAPELYGTVVSHHSGSGSLDLVAPSISATIAHLIKHLAEGALSLPVSTGALTASKTHNVTVTGALTNPAISMSPVTNIPTHHIITGALLSGVPTGTMAITKNSTIASAAGLETSSPEITAVTGLNRKAVGDLSSPMTVLSSQARTVISAQGAIVTPAITMDSLTSPGQIVQCALSLPIIELNGDAIVPTITALGTLQLTVPALLGAGKRGSVATANISASPPALSTANSRAVSFVGVELVCSAPEIYPVMFFDAETNQWYRVVDIMRDKAIGKRLTLEAVKRPSVR